MTTEIFLGLLLPAPHLFPSQMVSRSISHGTDHQVSSSEPGHRAIPSRVISKPADKRWWSAVREPAKLRGWVALQHPVGDPRVEVAVRLHAPPAEPHIPQAREIGHVPLAPCMGLPMNLVPFAAA